MIYGIIPVGGKGTRLGLPFSKEMLPLLGEDKYRPVMDITVQNMYDAGATAIYAVHGTHHKQDIVAEYPFLVHITQDQPSFGGVLKSFVDDTELEDNDTVFLGLPDSVYFDKMFCHGKDSQLPVLSCFQALDGTRVDRLVHTTPEVKLDIKAPYRHLQNSVWFWAGITFKGGYLKDCAANGLLNNLQEIGTLLNKTGFDSEPFGGLYYDTGTWEGYNQGMRAYDSYRSRRSSGI